MGLDGLRSILYSAYLLGCNAGASKCPLRSGHLRTGIVDGSVFGRFGASCLEVVGVESMMVDLCKIRFGIPRDSGFKIPTFQA
jgi:hypothetical protein